MLLPTLLVCCGGSVVAVPVAWVWRLTAEASQGAVSPDVAASQYLQALSYGEDEGLITVLDDEREEELLTSWRAYRNAMTRSEASRLSFGTLTVEPIQEGRAAVTVDVTAVWWSSSGGALSHQSEPLTWRFETRDTDDKWQVANVEAPAWCGRYVARCPEEAANTPNTSSSPSSPSPAPSEDLVKHPRSMLRCGPNDPFRALHSCPPTSQPVPSSS
ncbi:hypothetical protein GCM10010166_54330 [Couchioplanes caeruleus subsp. azureus]|nr:hypothetical protein GCM10010166_54330 [Couchioplanes caeruleus subsp. azureus]